MATTYDSNVYIGETQPPDRCRFCWNSTALIRRYCPEFSASVLRLLQVPPEIIQTLRQRRMCINRILQHFVLHLPHHRCLHDTYIALATSLSSTVAAVGLVQLTHNLSTLQS